MIPTAPSNLKRNYGHIKSSFDPRDIRFSATMSKLTALPAALNWLQFMGPVTDQQTEGCCTGEAGHYMREFLTRKWVRPANPAELSPQFIYQNAVLLEGQQPAQDPGATIRSTMRVLQKYGTCLEVDEPFDPAAVGTLPSSMAYTDALTYRAGVYKGLYSLTDIKQCIAHGFVFNLGFVVYDSFESAFTAQKGEVTMPQVGEHYLGGHAVCGYGYDDNYQFQSGLKGAVIFRNSWGTSWGKNGDFYMPYAFLSGGYVIESYMIHLGPMWT